MKALILYYSFSGKTKKSCEIMTKLIGADLYPVMETKKRNIFSAYIIGGHMAMKHKGSEIQPITIDVNAYDTLIIASPIWANAIAPAINTLLRTIDLKEKVIYGAISSGGGSTTPFDGFQKEIEANGGKSFHMLNIAFANTEDKVKEILADTSLI